MPRRATQSKARDHARHSKGNAKLRRAGLGKGREASMGPPVISFEVPAADMAGRAGGTGGDTRMSVCLRPRPHPVRPRRLLAPSCSASS